jgi:hypothetical protein
MSRCVLSLGCNNAGPHSLFSFVCTDGSVEDAIPLNPGLIASMNTALTAARHVNSGSYPLGNADSDIMWSAIR